MRKRIITGLILALLLTPIVVINNRFVFILFQLVMICFVIVASLEMLSMYEKEKKYGRVIKVIIIILTLFTYLNVGGFWQGSTAVPDLELFSFQFNNVAVIAFVTIALFSLLIFDENFTGSDIGKALTIINYVGLGAAAIMILRFLGVRFIVYVALISFTTDIFAYFFGIAFGKTKLAPKISPKKTWEGAIGGTIVGTLIASSFAIFYGDIFPVGTFLGDIFNQSGDHTIFDVFTSLGSEPLWVRIVFIVPITLLGSIAAQIGDLVASQFKRAYGIKDFGRIFPGHGGVLDRFDSILFISLLFVGIFLTLATVEGMDPTELGEFYGIFINFR